MAPEATVSERTPLLGQSRPPQDAPSNGNGNGKHRDPPPDGERGCLAWLHDALRVHVEKRILFAGFLITLAFSFTQVP